MFRLASLFLTLALGSALLGFGGILPAYEIVPRMLFVVSVLLSVLMMAAGGIYHSRAVALVPVPVRSEQEKPASARTTRLDRR